MLACARNRRVWPRSTAPLLVAALALLPACAGGDNWIESHPEVADRARAEPDRFTSAAWRQWEPVDALTGSYGLRVSRGVGSRSFDVSFVVQRPDRLEISFHDPTGAIEAFLIHGPGEIGLYFAEDRVLYRGASRPGAFERALGLELAPADVVAAVIGHAVVGGVDGSSTPVSEWDEEARRIRVDGARAVGWLHPVSLVWDRVEYAAGDLGSAATATGGGARSDPGTREPAVVAEFGRWRIMPVPEDAFEEATRLVEPSEVDGADDAAPADTVPIPVDIALDVADGSYGLTLELRGTPQLDPEIPPDYFQIPTLPSNVLTVPLSDLERQGGLFRRATEEDDGAGSGRR